MLQTLPCGGLSKSFYWWERLELVPMRQAVQQAALVGSTSLMPLGVFPRRRKQAVRDLLTYLLRLRSMC